MVLRERREYKERAEKAEAELDRLTAAQPDASPGAPSLTYEQAYAEIRDTLADSMLNTAQKKAFVISILEGKLANPPKFGGYNG